MDSILQAFLSFQFLLAAFAIAGINFFMRKVSEYLMATVLSKNDFVKKLWSDLMLPLSPLVTGFLCGVFATEYVYPADIKTTTARAAFGIVAGMFSGLVYRVTKSMLKQKLTTEEQSHEDNIQENKD